MLRAMRTSPAQHDERLWPGPLGWALVVGFGAVVLVALVPVDVRLGALVGGVVTAVGLGVAVRTSPRVSVADGVLRAGAAWIPVDQLGEPRALDRDGVRAALGPGSDARTYACLRAWIPGGVLVEVTDPQDPTPAWLVSTRRPGALAAAITAAQRGPARRPGEDRAAG